MISLTTVGISMLTANLRALPETDKKIEIYILCIQSIKKSIINWRERK